MPTAMTIIVTKSLCPSLIVTPQKRERAMSWLRPSISIEHTASNTEGLIWMVKEGDPANGRALPLGWEAGEP